MLTMGGGTLLQTYMVIWWGVQQMTAFGNVLKSSYFIISQSSQRTFWDCWRGMFYEFYYRCPNSSVKVL